MKDSPIGLRKTLGLALRVGGESWRGVISAQLPLYENSMTEELFTSIDDNHESLALPGLRANQRWQKPLANQ
ncbi:hypothetical protein [Pseudomonas sp. ML96]|uniref:hypothetical protein n=1 Tax=Pseudomonas sp. ML96 TaxID=1523503 RepID=UPI0012E08875|nr:hypothetical protein [Pseudomonas sp. ML96]